MLLTDRWVYSTGFGVSCSTDSPWPVSPDPCAMAGLNRPRPEAALSERQQEPGGHRREPEERPRMSESVTKARIVPIHTDRNRIIPRFSFMRFGGWGVLCHRSGHQWADSPRRVRRCGPTRLPRSARRGRGEDKAYLDPLRSGRQRWIVLIVPVPRAHRTPICQHPGSGTEPQLSLVPPDRLKGGKNACSQFSSRLTSITAALRQIAAGMSKRR